MVSILQNLSGLEAYGKRTHNSSRLGKYRTLGWNSCKIALRDASAAGSSEFGNRMLVAAQLRSIVVLRCMSGDSSLVPGLPGFGAKRVGSSTGLLPQVKSQQITEFDPHPDRRYSEIV